MRKPYTAPEVVYTEDLGPIACALLAHLITDVADLEYLNSSLEAELEDDIEEGQ